MKKKITENTGFKVTYTLKKNPNLTILRPKNGESMVKNTLYIRHKLNLKKMVSNISIRYLIIY